MEEKKIYFSADVLADTFHISDKGNEYEELEYPYSWEFKMMPAIKSSKIEEATDCSAHVYTIRNIKNTVAKLCNKYSITQEIFYECIWGITLKSYQYEDNAEFLSLYEDGIVCLRQISGEQDGFAELTENAAKSRYCQRLNQKHLDEFSENQNACLFEYISKNQDSFDEAVSKKSLSLQLSVQLFFNELGEDLKIYAFYNEKGYNEYAMSHLGDSIEKIIRSLEAGITSLSQINILGSKDILLLKNLSGHTSDYEIEKTIPEMIEMQAESHPDNIAIYFEDIKISYKELNGKANSLARSLIEKGIQRGEFVPVLMKRSPELIITLLAIMKSGAVFVPNDNQWNEEKVRNTVIRCKSNFVLTNMEPIYKQESVNTIFVSMDKLSIEQNVGIKVELEDNIYAIFTSGSTGEPKGAVNKHKGIVNRFLYMNKRYKIQREDTILLTSNHAFDSSVWQMFWPLINGNATVVPKPSNKMDLFEIMHLIEKYKITITDFVPSVFNLMVDVLQFRKSNITKLSSLRQLLIGGEEMSPKHIYEFKKLFPNCSITNTYGPAEASIGTVFYELPESPIETIPIGQPIDNVRVYLLNKNEKIMPVGAVGMLYLGGICVGSGYVNEKERTEGVFKNLDVFEEGNPFYVYKTGDMVQFNAEKDLDFYGRIDTQVKIHGVRVELKEIENAMNKIQGVVSSCATYLQGPEDKILSLYYVSEDESLNEVNVMDILKKMFPPYILSAYIRKIDKIPITRNGKLNYKELPTPC